MIRPYLGAPAFVYQRWCYIHGFHLRPISYPPIHRLPIRPVFLYPSVFRLIPWKDGDFVRPLFVSLVEEVFNTPSQVIRGHVACILTGVCCGDEICAPLCPMMPCEVLLGETFFHIMFSSHPIYHKLSLPDSFSDPVKLHVNCSWTSLADVVIDKPVSCGAVRNCWGGWLGVSHIYEHHVHRCASLSGYKKGSHFSFHCASDDVSHGCAFDMNWSIEWRLLEGGIIGIL